MRSKVALTRAVAAQQCDDRTRCGSGKETLRRAGKSPKNLKTPPTSSARLLMRVPRRNRMVPPSSRIVRPSPNTTTACLLTRAGTIPRSTSARRSLPRARRLYVGRRANRADAQDLHFEAVSLEAVNTSLRRWFWPKSKTPSPESVTEPAVTDLTGRIIRKHSTGKCLNRRNRVFQVEARVSPGFNG